ncbi:hypothetical protein ACWJPI_26785, partial [Klebsiella pneumoniae]|uniref:hypothetical protein n=1 Tax=Klebsiella pneumoniae TaxID=573 RepID=UPI0011597ED5|nr:hypothetical protein [Klebsiella pneumoniae]
MIYTIDNLPWIKERLNWQKESTHLALNQIISIYLTGSGMAIISREGANKQVISSQADSLIKISRIWADFFPANTSNQPI